MKAVYNTKIYHKFLFLTRFYSFKSIVTFSLFKDFEAKDLVLGQ